METPSLTLDQSPNYTTSMRQEPPAKNLQKNLSTIVIHSETPTRTRANLLCRDIPQSRVPGTPTEEKKKFTTKDKLTIKNYIPHMNTNYHEGELAEAINRTINTPKNWRS